jgi:hypothetical protein
LQKIGGCGDCFDAGAVSQQQIATSGAVSFNVSAGQRQIVGLSRDTTASTVPAMDYGFSFWADGGFDIRENNAYRTEGRYLATDVFQIAVAGGVVTYSKNGVAVYTSAVPVAGPMVIDTSLATPGATVSNATVK